MLVDAISLLRPEPMFFMVQVHAALSAEDIEDSGPPVTAVVFRGLAARQLCQKHRIVQSQSNI